MKNIFTLCLAMTTLLLGACAQDGSSWGAGNKQTIGTAAGAIGGGLLGSQVGGGSGQLWATGAGVLLGALVGSEVGKSLDRADQAYAQQALNQSYSAPIGETVSWTNPESGNYGSYTPVNEGYGQTSGRYCREYKQTIYVDGQAQTAYGTACKNPDGTWQMSN
ncbi:MAG: RT0821/Lpp0805 family surface protein [Pseudobdellovibrionaceae bacterium]